MKILFHSRIVKEHIPLQQGLILPTCSSRSRINEVKEHIPLQQGLILKHLGTTFNRFMVNEHLPIQQGLRLCGRTTSTDFVNAPPNIIMDDVLPVHSVAAGYRDVCPLRAADLPGEHD